MSAQETQESGESSSERHAEESSLRRSETTWSSIYKGQSEEREW